jgi:competence protein ComEA
MKNFWGIAFGIVFGFLGVGLLLLLTGKPRGEAVQLLPPPTPAPVLVHVAGAVSEPGLYSLPHGARVKDAVDLAGGLAEGADSNLINLAKPVSDGMQIWVPSVNVDQIDSNDAAINQQAQNQGQPTRQININTASQDELESLSGIGPVIAGAIIQYRQEHGAFNEISEIINVSGIGPVVFEKIKPFITTGGGADH